VVEGSTHRKKVLNRGECKSGEKKEEPPLECSPPRTATLKGDGIDVKTLRKKSGKNFIKGDATGEKTRLT